LTFNSFRRARVKEYEEGQTSVSEISRTYGVSPTAVYKWIKRYSLHYQKQIVKVVEEKSQTKKRMALEQRIQDLERLIGQQQVKISYYEQLVCHIDAHYEIDVEKNFVKKSSNGSSTTETNTD